MDKEKILLVDDEKDFIDGLSERMAVRGIEVVTAASGAEALDLVRRANFDAVVLDMRMPGLDGLEVLKRMLAHDETLQVIMLTGHATVSSGIEAMKRGAADYLEKPASIDTLVEMIKKAKMKRMALSRKQSEHAIQNLLKRRGW